MLILLSILLFLLLNKYNKNITIILRKIITFDSKKKEVI